MKVRLKRFPYILKRTLTDQRLLVFLWPFIFLLPYVISINNKKFASIGNDFFNLYYVYKYYLLSGLINFKLPLWSPSEAAGFPFYSSPFSQSFYPLNIPLIVFSFITKEYSVIDHQRFTVLGISIFGLGLYFWLSELRLTPRAVLFASLVMPISFKVVEILRFPNAIHTAAWYPWMLFSITKILKGQSIKEFLGYGILFSFSIVCLLTGGYFYYVYYSLFLFLPYLLILFIPYLRSSLVGQIHVDFLKVFMTLLISVLIALLLCMPFLLKVNNLLQQTTDRSGENFAYSTEHVFNFEDTLGSLVFPPAAQTEGWYFFGILALLLILIFLVSSKKYSGIDLTEKIFLILWFATISYITYGKDSILFKWLWYHIPGFSSLRVWGRMNIILIPLIAWLLAISYGSFECRLLKYREKRETTTLAITVILSYLAIFLLQLYYFKLKIYDQYWNLYVKKYIYLKRIIEFHFAPESPFLILGGLSFAFLFLIVLFRGRFFQFKYASATLLICATLLSTLELYNIGPFTWMNGWQIDQPSMLMNLPEANWEAFSRERIDIYYTMPLNKLDNVGVVYNWYFQRYVNFLNFAKSEPEQRDLLLGVTQKNRLYYSTSLSYDKISSYIKDAERFSDVIKTKFYDGDRLIVIVNAPQDGYLSFIDNWDPDWKLFVDGKEQPINLLFGTFKAAHLVKGLHEVYFHYSPWNLKK